MNWTYFFKSILYAIGVSLLISITFVGGVVTVTEYKERRSDIWMNARAYEGCLCEFGSFENLPEKQEFSKGAAWNAKAQCAYLKKWAEERGYEHSDRKYDGFPYYQEKHKQYLQRKK
jgi:hypothetical protein